MTVAYVHPRGAKLCRIVGATLSLWVFENGSCSLKDEVCYGNCMSCFVVALVSFCTLWFSPVVGDVLLRCGNVLCFMCMFCMIRLLSCSVFA